VLEAQARVLLLLAQQQRLSVDEQAALSGAADGRNGLRTEVAALRGRVAALRERVGRQQAMQQSLAASMHAAPAEAAGAAEFERAP
jgi:hypothetical protein